MAGGHQPSSEHPGIPQRVLQVTGRKSWSLSKSRVQLWQGSAITGKWIWGDSVDMVRRFHWRGCSARGGGGNLLKQHAGHLRALPQMHCRVWTWLGPMQRSRCISSVSVVGSVSCPFPVSFFLLNYLSGRVKVILAR